MRRENKSTLFWNSILIISSILLVVMLIGFGFTFGILSFAGFLIILFIFTELDYYERENRMDENMKLNIIDNFKSKNIEVTFFETLSDVKDRIIDLVPVDRSIGIGNSKTLKEMNITKILKKRGNVVFDKTLAESKEESEQIKKKSLLVDWYITGTNAISKEGHIVNIDHSGNRVAAMIYGPDNVIVVVGKNKICDTLDDAIQRVKNVSAPLNAKRAGYNPPCLKANRCVDCRTDERVCFNLVIIEGQFVKNRMKLFIVNEELGF